MTFLMWWTLLVVVCVHLAIVQAGRKIPVTVSCPFCDIAYFDDGVFSFQLTDQYDLSSVDHLNISVKTYVFNMTSTKYLEGGVDEALWWHTLIINIPDNLLHTETAFLMVAGLNNQQLVDVFDKELIGTSRIADATKSVTAAVYHIPRDPITFLSYPVPNEPLDSDHGLLFSLILYHQTLNPATHFIPSMTKVALKAMDLVQNPGIPGYNPTVEKFVVGGESKRGWATWMVGAIDDRVKAIIPVTSSSFLKLSKNVHHMFKSFGGYAFYQALYLYGGLFGYTDSRESRKAAKLADPFEYREYLTIPKLIVVAASDTVFLPDAVKFYIRQMPGENKLWILENMGHYLELYPGYESYWIGLGSYYASMLVNFPRPTLSWKIRYSKAKKRGRIVMFTDLEPESVKAFYASSVVNDRRDFRAVIWCSSCPAIKLCPLCPPLPISPSGVVWKEDSDSIILSKNKVNGKFKYVVHYDEPETGYLGFYMQMVFDGPNDADMTYTSEMNIIPKTFPSADCKKSACGDQTIPIV